MNSLTPNSFVSAVNFLSNIEQYLWGKTDTFLPCSNVISMPSFMTVMITGVLLFVVFLKHDGANHSGNWLETLLSMTLAFYCAEI